MRIIGALTRTENGKFILVLKFYGVQYPIVLHFLQHTETLLLTLKRALECL